MEAVGVEVTDAYYRLGGDRVRTALADGDERTVEASNGEQGIQLDAQRDEHRGQASTLMPAFLLNVWKGSETKMEKSICIHLCGTGRRAPFCADTATRYTSWDMCPSARG